MELANMQERYKQYVTNSYDTWLDRFTWNGLYNDMPQNAISIVNFEKQTHSFQNMPVMDSANSFYKVVSKMAQKYVDWCKTKDTYNEEECGDLRNFFMGCVGEYFFMVLLQDVKCLLIKNNAGNLERFDFDNVCPRLVGEDDYGVDLTGMVSRKNDYYNCAIQVKFWNPYIDTMFTNKIAAGVHSDAICNGFIDNEQNKNLVVCWLGDTRRVSKYLKANQKLYKHIVFIDKDALDKSINHTMPQFWMNLHTKLANIELFK